MFKGGLLSANAISEMTTNLHPLTDNFAAYQLAYGLGLEAYWNNGNPTPQTKCNGLNVLGHGGQDYGSGSSLMGYIPEMDVGVTFQFTASTESSPMGMACNLSYSSLPKVNAAQEALIQAVVDALHPSQNRSGQYKCSPMSLTPQPTSNCFDSPGGIGKINGETQYCSWLDTVAVITKQDEGTLCDTWFGTYTVNMMQYQWAPQYQQKYEPPPGVPGTTLMVDLCKGTCMKHGAGPCWLSGPQQRWC